ncbi:hypothetical protein [Paenibacillus sp. MBLB4367]|uniref:hypothetical protein n=1 Tax=Paenibacillus sp. MBLB4367 TaxID=3384767 RepID=UPI003908310B
MIKWLNWLSKWIVVTVLVSVLTVYVTWMTVHLYVEKLLGQFPLSANMKKLQFSDLWGQMIDDWSGKEPVADGKGDKGDGAGAKGGSAGAVSNGTGQTAGKGDSPVNGQPSSSTGGSSTGANGASSSTGKDAGTSGSGATGAGSGTGTNGTQQERVPDNALPVFGQATESGSDALDKKKLVMTADQFNQKRELLSDADKMRIFTLLLTRLPETELQRFSQMVEDGISSNDINELDTSIQKYLKPGEYDELMDILKKY